MNRILLLVLVAIFISITDIQAKSDFRDGFIITTSKDTLYGKIDYRSDFNNGKLCIFKTESGTVEYPPDKILGYGYLNDRFFSSQILEGIFVEVLVAGELNLYKSGYDFYVQKTGSELFKIESKKIRDTIEVEVTGRIDRIKVERQDLRWKGILSFLTSDCAENRDAIDQLLLLDKSLRQFVINYNKCKGSGFISYQVTIPRFKIDYGISAGLVSSTIKFKSLTDQYNHLSDHYKSYNPGFGFLFAISSPRITERFALQVEGNFHKTSFNSQIVDVNDTYTGYYDTEVGYSTVSVPLSLRYNIPIEKSSIFFNAGIDFSYIVDSYSNLNKEILSGNVVDTYLMNAFDFYNHPLGYFGDIGYLKSFKNFRMGATLKYCHSSELISNEEINSGLNTISLSLLLLGR